MPEYSWMTDELMEKAEKVERKAAPMIKKRRLTDKSDLVDDFVVKHDWPRIPQEADDYSGERFMRVFIGIKEGPEQRDAPDDAPFAANLEAEDAQRAGLTKDDAFLVVPLKFWIWQCGALAFEKSVLLSLSQPIMEHRLEHDDAEIWGDVVWITPMKEKDRKYFYSVLPLVGIHSVIDPEKGNPSIFAPLQDDPYRHIVWDIVDEVIAKGITAWGSGAAGGDGSAAVFNIKLRYVNFLRSLADEFYVERHFLPKWRDRQLQRKDVLSAIERDDLWRHLAHRQEEDFRRLRSQYLRAADQCTWDKAVRLARLGYHYRLSDGLKEADSGYGTGWTPNAGAAREEAEKLITLGWICERAKSTRELIRMFDLLGGWRDYESKDAWRELADEIADGEITLEDAALIAQHIDKLDVTFPANDRADEYVQQIVAERFMGDEENKVGIEYLASRGPFGGDRDE